MTISDAEANSFHRHLGDIARQRAERKTDVERRVRFHYTPIEEAAKTLDYILKDHEIGSLSVGKHTVDVKQAEGHWPLILRTGGETITFNVRCWRDEPGKPRLSITTVAGGELVAERDFTAGETADPDVVRTYLLAEINRALDSALL